MRRRGFDLRRARAWSLLIALIAAATGTFEALSVPSAPLFGGLAGALIHALGANGFVKLPASTFRVAQGIVGATVGALVDWSRLWDLGAAWPAVLGTCVTTLGLSVGVGQLLRLHRGVSPATASFATVAGGASGMTAMANEFGADDRVVTVVQYLRVLFILATLPVAVPVLFGTGAHVFGAIDPRTDPLRDASYAVIAVGGGLLLGRLLRLPSPAILGGIAVGTAVASVPTFEGARVPVLVQAAAFLLIGAQVGLRFTRAALRQIARMLPTAVLVIALIVTICAILGLVLSTLTGVSRLDGYLATTPGGLPAVLAATTSTGGDVTFVSTVQVLRVLIVLFVSPFLAGRIFGTTQGE